jgi:outer membrane protein
MRLWVKASIITFAIALVILFFQSYWFLDGKDIKDLKQNNTSENGISPEPQTVKLLKDSLFVSTIPENYSNFALQLSNIYFENGSYDSAASYKELIAIRFPNEENWESAGLAYYKAFQHAVGEAEEQSMVMKAIDCLEKGFGNTSSVEVKLVLANLYFAYEKPIEATDLLNEVLVANAENKEALYILGVHLFQINKFEKAGEYLSQLVKVDTSHTNGLYLLAVTKFKIGNKKEAKVLFEKLKLLDISDEVRANADDYLSDIK